MKNLLIPISEYNRIHQLAHGVLRDVANVERACMFFAIFGSWLLNKHYKIPARPVAGVFALCVTDEPALTYFGEHERGKLRSNSNAFHMWIQTETHIIDFMAPLFPEIFSKHSFQPAIPRRMFQKQLSDGLERLDEMKRQRDFFTLENPELTVSLQQEFYRTPANRDLIQVGETWFGRRSGKQKPTMRMRNDLGEVYDLRLSCNSTTSPW
jgi:hypothetical protein